MFKESFEKVALFGFGSNASSNTPPPPPPKPPAANAVQMGLNKAFGIDGKTNIIGRR